MNQSGPSLLFIRALPRYATAANVRLRTVGEKRPVIAYLQMAVFNKGVNGPFQPRENDLAHSLLFQQNSTLIPFQPKSIFRNAEKGKITATNQ